MLKSRTFLAAGSAIIWLLPSVAHALPGPTTTTAAEIVKLDEAWGDAEGRGDADFVDRLLLPAYRSIGQDGKVVTKRDIVDHTRARGPSADYQAKVAAWKAQHPLRSDVTFVGSTAILTWISAKQGSGDPVSSCDIFVFTDGRWRALYSQHSAAAT